jgi:hypothetical protein
MMTRMLCGLFAVAMAGPCLAQAPSKASRPVAQTTVKQGSSYTAPAAPQPMASSPTTPRVGNCRSCGNGYNPCYPYGPGTQYMNLGCSLRLDLSNGIGLCDPCNCMGPHPRYCRSCCWW